MNAISKLKALGSQLRLLISNDQMINKLRNKGLMSVGEFTYGNPRVYSWENRTSIKIGKYCSIAADVTILLGGEHRLDWVSTFPFMEFQEDWPEASLLEGHPSSKGDIFIGNDVWIGNGATILSGVRIGHGAVVGAGSLVSRDVPDYSIVNGNPLRLNRMRFEEEIISALLEIAWWDWPTEIVRKNFRSILSTPTKESLETLLTISRTLKQS